MGQEEQEKKLAGLYELLITSVCWGSIPLGTALLGGKFNPVLFATMWHISGTAGLCFLVRQRGKRKGTRPNREYYKAILKVFLNSKSANQEFGGGGLSVFKIFRGRSILIPFQRLNLILYAWSIRYVHDAVAAVIFNIYPLFQALLFKKIDQKPGEGYLITRRTIFFNIMAFSAAGLVILSDIYMPSESATTVLAYLVGLSALVFTIVLTLQIPPRHRQAKMLVNYRRSNSSLTWMEDSSNSASEQLNDEDEEQIVIVILDILSYIFASLFGAVLLLFLYIFGASVELPSFSLTFIIVLLISSNLSVLGLYFHGKGTTKGKDLRVQNVLYLVPVVGVLLLILIFPFSGYIEALLPDVSLSSEIIWPWFVVGLMGVAIAILLSHLESEQGRFGLTSFVVALWVAGAIIYFRDEWVWWSDSITSIGTASLEYYAFLGVSSTVFALLIAFEVSRLEQRTVKEQDIIFWLLSKFSKEGSNGDKMLGELRELDQSKNIIQTQESYNKIQNELAQSGQEIDEETITKLNSLAFSKQSGVDVSGRTAIIMLALFSIILSLSFRPSNVLSISAVLVDLFAFLISAVMAYLTFHLFDLRNTRARSSIEPTGFGTGYRVEFQNPTTREETSIATSLVVIITVVYGILFAIKWL